MKFKSILTIIFLFSLIIRLYKIAEVPPGFSNDEISIAYNAYSIAETAKDEYGETLPIAFRSHNTFKAPLYIYLTAPSVILFGNSVFSVRLASALLGSLTVLVLGLLVFEVTRSKKASLWSAFLLAVTPWHFYTSRVALESNIALFFVVLGVYLFSLSVKKKLYLYLSLIIFALSMYAYHTEWIFVPMLLFGLAVLYKDKLFAIKKSILAPLLLFLLLISPLIFTELGNLGDTTRASTEFFFRDIRFISLLGENVGSIEKLLLAIDFLLKEYLNYFGFDYLFFNGLTILNPFSAQTIGLLLMVQFALYIPGLIYIFSGRLKKYWIVIFWLLIGPIVPAFTLGGANLVRNLVTVIPLTIIEALGILWWTNVFKRSGKRVFCITTVVVLILNFMVFAHFYFHHFPLQLSENWSYGFKEIAQFVGEKEDNYNSIIVDPNYGTIKYDLVGVPSLFILYFNEYRPQEYLDDVQSQEGRLTFFKYDIRKVDWPKEDVKPGSLYVVGVHSSPLENQNMTLVKTIQLLDGRDAFKLYESEKL